MDRIRKRNIISFLISSRSTSVRAQEGGLTAASLIDAIITHQISQTTPEPPVSRDGHRPSIVC